MNSVFGPEVQAYPTCTTYQWLCIQLVNSHFYYAISLCIVCLIYIVIVFVFKSHIFGIFKLSAISLFLYLDHLPVLHFSYFVSVNFEFCVIMLHMFGLSLSTVVGRSVHVLFMLFGFACVQWCLTHIVFCFVFLRIVYPMLPSPLDCQFLIAPSLLSNVYLLHLPICSSPLQSTIDIPLSVAACICR